MTKFNDIYEIASDNYGLITSAQAREVGISNKELVQYAIRGKIERVGQGVYRLVQRIPEPNDGYALAVALVGPGAFLYHHVGCRFHELAGARLADEDAVCLRRALAITIPRCADNRSTLRRWRIPRFADDEEERLAPPHVAPLAYSTHTLAHRLVTLDVYRVGLVNHAIDDGVGYGTVAQLGMPRRRRELRA